MNKRTDGKYGSAVTVQFHKSAQGEKDSPWSKKTGNSQKKDQFFLAISGIPEDWTKEADCFRLMAGVLPQNFDHMLDFSECASTQKDVGY